MLDWPREKLRQRNSVAADQQLALWLERVGKCRETGLRGAGATAFHLDRSQPAARTHDEVDFLVPVAPIEQLTGEDGRKPFTIYSMY